MNIDYNQKLVVVTGAGRGLGRAIALAFCESGATVVAADRDPDLLEETAALQSGNGLIEVRRTDVASRADCAALATEIGARLGPIDVLVNNAGIARATNLLDPTASAKDWDETFAVNVHGLYDVTLAFLPQLITSRGNVVNIASIQSFVARKGSVPYTASKAAVRGLTTAMAAELGEHGVRVNAVAPGLIATPMSARMRGDEPAISGYLDHSPIRRVADPEDIAAPILFLASAQARMITGATLSVDGGYLTV